MEEEDRESKRLSSLGRLDETRQGPVNLNIKGLSRLEGLVLLAHHIIKSKKNQYQRKLGLISRYDNQVIASAKLTSDNLTSADVINEGLEGALETHRPAITTGSILARGGGG
ncbi:hypothetical protein NC652_013867 [Populus alba x Populus x berolinensis]|nr:hypothetical protein NC652_013867 [Populus alba x Populus x berolinensis]